MNMLQIQDALKGASDAQLMQEMQSPTGIAPQFLVLSEMKRRKDMRSQQQAAPQGTVAEELTQASQPREVLPLNEREPEYEDDEEEMAAGGLVGLRRYAEGGIVRGREGMVVVNGIAYPADEYDRMEVPSIGRRRNPRARPTPVEPDPFYAEAERRRAEGAPRGLPGQGYIPPEVSTPGGVAPLAEDSRPTLQVAPLAEDEPRRAPDPVPGMTPNYGEGVAFRAPPGSAPQAGRPTGGTRAAPAPAPAAGGGGGGGGLPDLQGAAPSQAGSQIPDRLDPILQRIRDGRTDGEARRSEAMNMALIEAGLRIAGSNSPRLAGAISEGGVPALQAFSQQASQIRQDQRQDLRDELQTAIAQNQNDFQRGRLSQQEFATRQQYLLGMARLRQDGAQAGAANSIAQQRLELERNSRITPEQYTNATPEQREVMDRFLGRGRDPQSSLLGRAANDLSDGMARIDAIEQREVAAAQNNGATPAQIQAIQGRYNQRRMELEQRYRILAPNLFPQLPTGTTPRSGATVVAPIGS